MINVVIEPPDENSEHKLGFPCPLCHVIKVKQPFASLIALGFRHYQYCSHTRYRGRVVIHASQSWHSLALPSLIADHFSKLTNKPEQAIEALFPLGRPVAEASVAEASVTDCTPRGNAFAITLDQVTIVERPKPPLRDIDRVPWKLQPTKELAQALSRARVLQGPEKDDVYRAFGLLALHDRINSWLRVNPP
jgi:hypothetical protein